jgi:hypothetical protein
MADKDQTTAASGPLAPCQETGISPLVKAELGKLHPEIAAKIKDHVARKG